VGSPICSTCGPEFVCYADGPPVVTDPQGWFTCSLRCPICSGSLRDGRAVMEHPGLAATLHLVCCPTPEDPDLWNQQTPLVWEGDRVGQ